VRYKYLFGERPAANCPAGEKRADRPTITKQIFTVYNDAANLFKYWFFLSLVVLAGDAFNFLGIARAAHTCV